MTTSKLLKLLLFLLLGSGVRGQSPSIVQSSTGSAARGAPLSLALTAAPAPGNMVWVIILYQVYTDYDFLPPDSSWTCTLGGRSLPSAAGGYRINTCSHIVVTGDPAAYTFTPTGSDAPGGPSATIFETSKTVGSQIAYSYTNTSTSQMVTPALTPTVASTLPIAVSLPAGTPSSGWNALPSSPVAYGPVTTDTTSPISTTFTQYNYGQSLQETMLLTPGAFAAAPLASPVAGTYASAQSVSLTTATAGGIVHYTLDGSVPTCASPAFSSPISIAASTPINALTCAAGYANSAVLYASYVIGPGSLSGISLGINASLNGYTPWQSDLWHQDIFSASVDPNSATIMSTLTGVAGSIRHDWSSTNHPYGIPYVVVDSTITPQTSWATSQDPSYIHQTDWTLAPIPSNIPIEQNPPACTLPSGADSHAIVLDRHSGLLYEWWRFVNCAPAYSANNGAIFDLKQSTSVQRPYGFTSADAGSLSIFEGLVRYDEILAGAITHAIRFTLKYANCNYQNGSAYSYFQLPSTSGTSACAGGALSTANNIANYGMKLRLKASFDISGYSATNQIILTGLKHYGLMLADLSNNNTIDFQGAPDPRWSDADLAALDSIASSNFEVVQKGTVYNGANAYPRDPATAAAGSPAPLYVGSAAPHIAGFTSSSAVVPLGGCVTLTANVTGASLLFVDLAGVMTGSSVSDCPSSLGTKTYTLTASSPYLAGDDGFEDGYRPTASVIVAVIPQVLSSPQGMAGWQGYRPQ